MKKSKQVNNPLNAANSVVIEVTSADLCLNFRLITLSENGKLVLRAQSQSVCDLENVWQNFADDWGYEYLPTHSLTDGIEQFSEMMKRSLDFFVSEGDFEDGDELTVDAE